MKKVILLIVVGLIAGAGGVGLRYIQDGSLGSLKGDAKNVGGNLCLPLLNIQTQLPTPEYGMTLESGILSILKQDKAYALIYPFPVGESVSGGATQPAFKAAASGWDVYVRESTSTRGGTFAFGVQAPTPFFIIPSDASNREAIRALVNQLKPVKACPEKTSQLTILPGKLDGWVAGLTKEQKEYLGLALDATATPYRKQKITMEFFEKSFECKNAVLAQLIASLTPAEKETLIRLRYSEAEITPEIQKYFFEGGYPEAINFISTEYLSKRLEAEFSKTKQLEMTRSLGGSVSVAVEPGIQNCFDLAIMEGQNK